MLMDRSLGSAVGWRLVAGWTTEELEFESRWGQYSLLHVVQNACGAHPTSYPVGTGPLSPGIKRQGREADIWNPSCAHAKNASVFTSTRRDSSYCGR
jgi:hypothetical protein